MADDGTLDDNDELGEALAAAFVDRKPETLRWWRANPAKHGPLYRKLKKGSGYAYRVADLRAFIAAQDRLPVAAAVLCAGSVIDLGEICCFDFEVWVDAPDFDFSLIPDALTMAHLERGREWLRNNVGRGSRAGHYRV